MYFNSCLKVSEFVQNMVTLICSLNLIKSQLIQKVEFLNKKKHAHQNNKESWNTEKRKYMIKCYDFIISLNI